MKKLISRRQFLAAAGVVAAAGALSACGSSSSTAGSAAASAGDTIKVGVLAPLTGEVSNYGLAVSNGVQLYLEQVNEAGGINGKQIEVILMDEQGDATQAVNCFTQMVDEGITGLIGDVTTAPTLAVVAESQDYNMPMVTASATADCVIPPVQPADKCPAPGLFRCSFHLFICGIRPSHPDIFPDCPVKEIIILRHICDLSIELFHRNTSQISSAKCDPSAAHIPETGNEFSDRGFARSGRTYQSSDRSRHDLQADIMQHFAALFFVCKRNVIQADRCSVQYCFPNRPLQFRRIQDSGNLPYIRSHHSKLIHKGHGRQQRSCQPQCQDDNSEEHRCLQGASRP